MNIIRQVVANAGNDSQTIKMIVQSNERGPAGKDGAIQYQAGSGIKISDDNVISVFGSAGGAVDWGQIGGTITNQTDLQTALTNVQTACNNATDTKLADYTPTANLATVATTGSYADLSNKPTIPVITLSSTDVGEGVDLPANHFIAVYGA